MFGRGGVDQIDYGVCQIRQMDDEVRENWDDFRRCGGVDNLRPVKRFDQICFVILGFYQGYNPLSIFEIII